MDSGAGIQGVLWRKRRNLKENNFRVTVKTLKWLQTCSETETMIKKRRRAAPPHDMALFIQTLSLGSMSLPPAHYPYSSPSSSLSEEIRHCSNFWSLAQPLLPPLILRKLAWASKLRQPGVKHRPFSCTSFSFPLALFCFHWRDKDVRLKYQKAPLDF